MKFDKQKLYTGLEIFLNYGTHKGWTNSFLPPGHTKDTWQAHMDTEYHTKNGITLKIQKRYIVEFVGREQICHLRERYTIELYSY